MNIRALLLHEAKFQHRYLTGGNKEMNVYYPGWLSVSSILSEYAFEHWAMPAEQSSWFSLLVREAIS